MVGHILSWLFILSKKEYYEKRKMLTHPKFIIRTVNDIFVIADPTNLTWRLNNYSMLLSQFITCSAVFSCESIFANAHITVFLIQWNTRAVVFTRPTAAQWLQSQIKNSPTQFHFKDVRRPPKLWRLKTGGNHWKFLVAMLFPHRQINTEEEGIYWLLNKVPLFP